MLVVFLAVPALQRSSRNNQREADATKVTAAMSSCISNRNGEVTSCDTVAKLENTGGLDQKKLQQLTTVTNATSVAAANTVPNENTINFIFGAKCSKDTSAAEASTSSRQGAVVYRIETTGTAVNKCIDV